VKRHRMRCTESVCTQWICIHIVQWSNWKYYVLMYENEKMRPVETIPGMGGRE
jgi:hypothetical protein